MNYVSIKEYKPEEIEIKLSGFVSDDEAINLVLSAIYFCNTQFSGDILMKILNNSSNNISLPLMKLIDTYLQMHRTNYNADEFLKEMKKKLHYMTENQSEILELIEGVMEFKEMFNSSGKI